MFKSFQKLPPVKSQMLHICASCALCARWSSSCQRRRQIVCSGRSPRALMASMRWSNPSVRWTRNRPEPGRWRMRSKWSLSGNESVRWFMMNDDMFLSYLFHFRRFSMRYYIIFRTQLRFLGIRCAKPCWAVSKEVLDPGAWGGGGKHVRFERRVSVWAVQFIQTFQIGLDAGFPPGGFQLGL